MRNECVEYLNRRDNIVIFIFKIHILLEQPLLESSLMRHGHRAESGAGVWLWLNWNHGSRNIIFHWDYIFIAISDGQQQLAVVEGTGRPRRKGIQAWFLQLNNEPKLVYWLPILLGRRVLHELPLHFVGLRTWGTHSPWHLSPSLLSHKYDHNELMHHSIGTNANRVRRTKLFSWVDKETFWKPPTNWNWHLHTDGKNGHEEGRRNGFINKRSTGRQPVPLGGCCYWGGNGSTPRLL